MECNVELWTNAWHLKMQDANKDTRSARLDDMNY